jgi:hypothetical protein
MAEAAESDIRERVGAAYRIREVLRTMCDYSLMAVPNRLAQEGEDLVVHRFCTGSLGLASLAELTSEASMVVTKKTFWALVKEFFSLPPVDAVCAVCIPPGASLELQGIAERLQRDLGVGPIERVTFTQITANSNTYRDAVRFANRRELRLQELPEGMRVKVLDLSMAEDLNLDLQRELSQIFDRAAI